MDLPPAAPGRDVVSLTPGGGIAWMDGTSMAAPHVSGAIAVFLSARHEFIGQPEAVKRIFVSTATDLKRDRYFQGDVTTDSQLIAEGGSSPSSASVARTENCMR